MIPDLQPPQDGDTADSNQENIASPVDTPAQALDVPEREPDTALKQNGTQRVGESGVGAQRDHDSEFTEPAGDGNYQKVGDRDVSISGQDEVQQ